MATIAMLLPITFDLPPVSALIMLAGIYYGSQYGGSTTAILVNLPGEAASVVTALDGYQMAQQGRAGSGADGIGSRFVFRRNGRDLAARPVRAAAGRSGAQVRPRGLFFADGARSGRLGGAGSRIAVACDRHGRARSSAGTDRHRRQFGRAALHLRYSRARRRHRLCHRRYGHVRPG